MATSKVGALPPSKAKLSRCGPLSSKSTLTGNHDTLSSLQLLQDNWILQASSFLPSEHSFSAKLCQNGSTVDCDCLMHVQREDGETTVHRGLFSFFISSLPQGVHQSWVESVIFVPSYADLKCFGPELPTCANSGVQRNGSLRRPKNCFTDSRKQHTPCDSSGFTATTADDMNCAVISLPGSEKSCDIIPRSHYDEITCCCEGIHAGGNRIHADEDSDTGSEYYSDSERCDGDGDYEEYSDSQQCDGDYDEQGRDTHSCNLSTPTKSLPAPDKAHLAVNQSHPQLKKLLSDESGYYENVSSGFAVSPCDWSQKSVLLTAEDIEEWEDEDSTGDEEVDDEAADLLWKSFEDCVLSPQTLHMKPRNKTLAAAAAVASTHSMLTADASSEGDESMMQFRIPGCQTTALYKDCQPKHNTHVEFHADTPLHKGETCLPVVTTDTSPCWQVDHVTTKDAQSINRVCVDVSSEASACFHTSTKKQVQLDDVAPGSQLKACLHHLRKQVRFPSDSSISVVHEIVAWNYAYRAARKGPWELYARNRAHFRRKIDKLALVIEPCLAKKLAKS